MNILVHFIVLLFAYGCVAPPVTEKKKKDKAEDAETNEVDPQVFDVEYKRYLQEVVNVLEGDEEFRNRLMKADPEDIKNGKIAKELEFVNHNVRSKLDELKRQELERLRHAAIQQYEYSNGIDKKHLKIPGHVDPKNPHTFETEDLRKLITHTAKELEDNDRQRKEEFKEYEMQKELQYQEQLKHMDEKNREEAQKQHEGQVKKHNEHQPLHHPGSKQQFEQVWEEQDHLSPENFNPKTFFHLHDLDGNGVWDANEVKALFKKELDKMYDPNAPEDDVRERFEEMERMREHVFNETDTNRDQLISYDEFVEQTKRQEFERDDGWKGLDEQPAYSPEEYKNYARDHEEEIRRMIDQGLIPAAPPGYVPLVIPPGHDYHPQQGQIPLQHQPPYHVPPQGLHPNEIPQHPAGNQQQQHYQPQPPPQQYHQQPQQYHQQPPPQQYHQQPPQQQFHQQQPPQQYHQQPPPQQYHQQVPSQQFHQQPPPQQYHQQPPPQQYQQHPGEAQQHVNAVPSNQGQYQQQQPPVQPNSQLHQPAHVDTQHHEAVPVQSQPLSNNHETGHGQPAAVPLQHHDSQPHHEQQQQNHAAQGSPSSVQDGSHHLNAASQAPVSSHGQPQQSH